MMANDSFKHMALSHQVACSQLQLPAPNGGIIYTYRNDGHQWTYHWCALSIQWSPPSEKVETTNYTDTIKKQPASNALLSMQKSPDSIVILDLSQLKINIIATTPWNTFLKNLQRVNAAGFTTSGRL